MDEGISLVIPAYNEASRIREPLLSYTRDLRALRIPFEIIVVIDGHDDTAGVVNRLGLPEVKTIRFARKLGRGGAIFEGFRAAYFGVVAYVDADGSVPSSELIRLIKLAGEGNAAVIASRRLDPRQVVVPEPLYKRSAGFVWRHLVRVMLGLRVADAQCGLKVFSRAVVSTILRRVTVTNRTFEVDMLYHVSASGVPILEVPVAYSHNSETRMPILLAIPVMFMTLVGITLVNRTPIRKPAVLAALHAANRVFASV